MKTQNPAAFWSGVAKRKNWLDYILPKRSPGEFDQEGAQQAAAIQEWSCYRGGTVVEYGCGVGRITRHIKADRVIGLDICEAFLEKARAADPRTHYALTRDFADADVADFVFSVSVMLHNTPRNCHAIMAHIAKMLKPGGHCLVMFAHGPAYRESSFVHKFTRDEVLSLAGPLEVVSLTSVNLVRYGGRKMKPGEMNELALVGRKP